MSDLISRAEVMALAKDVTLINGAKHRCIDATQIHELPSTERRVAHIQDFTQYQIDWLTAHCDLELEPKLESWVIRFLEDTADCYDKEYLTSAERTGHWIYKDLDNFRKYEVECSECGAKYIGNYDAYDEPEDFNYCPNCGARMVSEDD